MVVLNRNGQASRNGRAAVSFVNLEARAQQYLRHRAPDPDERNSRYIRRFAREFLEAFDDLKGFIKARNIHLMRRLMKSARYSRLLQTRNLRRRLAETA